MAAFSQRLDVSSIRVGDSIPECQYGPLTIVDTVRWAGLQENWQHLHFDRDYVREHNGLRSFIASGDYRRALLIRTLTDWAGPGGWIGKLSVRHTYPTFEGDMMLFGGRVIATDTECSDLRITCNLEGKNQDGKQILTGTGILVFPAKTSPGQSPSL